MIKKVYTKKGDDGTTSFLSGKRVSKLFPEIKSVGALDELNSFIGLLRSELPLVGESFDIIQWNLFNAGSAIINDNNLELPNVGESDIKMLEDWMDEMNEELPELKNFIIPKGSKAVSLCHVCRTICRRAEIQVIDCQVLDNIKRISPIVKYLNRLSDYFFVLARYVGHKENLKETIWKN